MDRGILWCLLYRHLDPAGAAARSGHIHRYTRRWTDAVFARDRSLRPFWRDDPPGEPFTDRWRGASGYRRRPHSAVTSSAGRHRLLEEEAQHLPGGVGPPRIGVGPRRTAARPGMAGGMDDPLLQDRPPALIVLHGAAVGMPPGYLTMLHTELQVWRGGLLRPSDDGVTIAGMHGGVLIAMEHDRRNAPQICFAARGIAGSADRDALSLPHGGERRRQIAGGAAGEAGMHADRSVEIGIG